MAAAYTKQPFENEKHLKVSDTKTGMFTNALDLYARRTDKPRVKHPRFKLTLVSHHSLGSVEREKLWAHWAYGFKLKKHQCRDKVKESAKRLKGHIMLSLYSLEPDTIPKSDNRPADWGFRLGLYVLALIMDV